MHSGKSPTPVSGIRSLSHTQLARRTDPQQFPFDDTAAVTPSSAIIGQDRAVEAIRLGLGIRQHGFDVFAVGTPGHGAHVTGASLAAESAAYQEWVTGMWRERRDVECPTYDHWLRAGGWRLVTAATEAPVEQIAHR
jgi:hypothetical protein